MIAYILIYYLIISVKRVWNKLSSKNVKYVFIFVVWI